MNAPEVKRWQLVAFVTLLLATCWLDGRITADAERAHQKIHGTEAVIVP